VNLRVLNLFANTFLASMVYNAAAIALVLAIAGTILPPNYLTASTLRYLSLSIS